MFTRGLLYKNGYIKHKTGKADMEQPMFSINMKPDALAPHRWAMEGSQFVLGELMLSTYSTQLYGLKNALVTHWSDYLAIAVLLLTPKCAVEDFTENGQTGSEGCDPGGPLEYWQCLNAVTRGLHFNLLKWTYPVLQVLSYIDAHDEERHLTLPKVTGLLDTLGQSLYKLWRFRTSDYIKSESQYEAILWEPKMLCCKVKRALKALKRCSLAPLF